MLADLTNSDLLELGSLKEIYDQTDEAATKFETISDRAKSAGRLREGFAIAAMIVAMAILTIATAGAFAAIAAAAAVSTLAVVGGVALGLAAASMLGMMIGMSVDCGNNGNSKQFYGTDCIIAGDKDNLLEAYWANRNAIKLNDDTAQIKSQLGTFTEALLKNMDGDYLPYPCSLEGISTNKKVDYGSGCDESATNGFQLTSWAPASGGWGLTGHYKYLANAMADAAGLSSGDFTSGSNQWMIEAFDMFSHQKYYGSPKGVYKENYTEPDYDYNALILMYKMEALADVYGDIVANMAVNYLSGRDKAAQTIDGLNKLADPVIMGDSAITPDDVKMIKTYIDGKNLFTEDEDIPDYEKKTLTQCWTEKDDIKAVLNKLYGDGSKGLNADEVSLWSENMRMHIDKITTNGQTLSTKMQRMMQRCNETTSLATQMLKSIGDLWKQLTGNIR
jgi:hypothetical protein